jgi:hypothetical protein
VSDRGHTLEPGLAQPNVLREYALLADGERGVLVGPRGDFVFMCFPRWHDDALFSSLVGGRGAYAVTPKPRFVWGGHYEAGGLIWRSRWTTEENGIVECREALALPARTDRAVVLRRVHATAGRARVDVVLNLCGRFGGEPVRDLARDEDGNWRGTVAGAHFCWTGGSHARVEKTEVGGQALTMELDVEEGGHHDLVLTIDAHEPPEAADPDRAWEETEAQWRERVPATATSTAARDSRHALAVLAGLTSTSGAMVAAATMSLPERARAGRNYDYRYAWIRDQAFAGQAVAKAGPHQLLDDAVRFVRERLLEDGPRLRPAYTVAGDDVPDQRDLDLAGYPGGSAVVGNWVNRQFQLDAFGEALLLFAAAARHDHLDAEGWRAIEVAADAIAERWREYDAGIWELEPAEWTHSRLICAAGLRQASEIGPGGERAARWLSLADTLVADTARRATHPSGRWQRAVGDERLDAALLIPPLRGGVPPDDPRSVATLRAIDSDLTQEGYAYRFRPDARPLGAAEGAFLLCNFLLALAWGQQGDRVAAARWFERARAACGPPGLLSEEFDVEQRQLRGNLPQAFVHAMLLECAIEQDRF